MDVGTSNDPAYTNGSLWGMYGDTTVPANKYGSQAAEAWANGTTGSKDVYVGIIDEGAQWKIAKLEVNGIAPRTRRARRGALSLGSPGP